MLNRIQALGSESNKVIGVILFLFTIGLNFIITKSGVVILWLLHQVIWIIYLYMLKDLIFTSFNHFFYVHLTIDFIIIYLVHEVISRSNTLVTLFTSVASIEWNSRLSIQVALSPLKFSRSSSKLFPRMTRVTSHASL